MLRNEYYCVWSPGGYYAAPGPVEWTLAKTAEESEQKWVDDENVGITEHDKKADWQSCGAKKGYRVVRVTIEESTP
jgi:hypothetical protein